MTRIFFYALAIVLLVGSYASALPNKALLLEGDPDSYFEAPDNDAFHNALGSELTIEAWVFTKTQGAESMVVNKEDSWEFAVNNGIFQSALQPAGGAWEWLDSGVKIENEKWTHLAITWDGAEVRMFVNGKEGNKAPKAGKAVNATNSTFKVGRRERGDATHSIFDGLIDEVRVSKGLRYTEDFDLPQGAFDPDADTLALYHFDEDVGGKVKDFSKSGVDGKLVGKAKLVEIDLPNTFLSVEAHGKLATLWGRLKAQ